MRRIVDDWIREFRWKIDGFGENVHDDIAVLGRKRFHLNEWRACGIVGPEDQDTLRIQQSL